MLLVGARGIRTVPLQGNLRLIILAQVATFPNSDGILTQRRKGAKQKSNKS